MTTLHIKDSEKFVGMGIYVGHPYRQFVIGLLTFPYHFISGKLRGYPTCCVFFYCIMNMTELPTCSIMDLTFNSTNSDHVMCPVCTAKSETYD
jgi:hypothetical protein